MLRNGFVHISELDSADLEDTPLPVQEGTAWLIRQVGLRVTRDGDIARSSARGSACAGLVQTIVTKSCIESGPSRLSSGPKLETIKLAKEMRSDEDAENFIKKARVDAILGAAPRSHPRIICGIKAWASFCKLVLRQRGNDLPPSEEGLIAWSRVFRSAGTFGNYLGAVKTACLLANQCTDVFASTALYRAKMAVKKAEIKKPLSPPISREITKLLMDVAIQEDDPLAAALYCVSYAFLLRVPSEGLPLRITVNGPGVILSGKTLVLSETEATLHFDRRKNRETATAATRHCWCAACKHTCPVHRLLPLVAGADSHVAAPFVKWRPHVVTQTLRRRLSVVKVPNATTYTRASGAVTRKRS